MPPSGPTDGVHLSKRPIKTFFMVYTSRFPGHFLVLNSEFTVTAAQVIDVLPQPASGDENNLLKRDAPQPKWQLFPRLCCRPISSSLFFHAPQTRTTGGESTLERGSPGPPTLRLLPSRLTRWKGSERHRPARFFRPNPNGRYGPQDRTTYRWAFLQRAGYPALSIIMGDDRRLQTDRESPHGKTSMT